MMILQKKKVEEVWKKMKRLKEKFPMKGRTLKCEEEERKWKKEMKNLAVGIKEEFPNVPDSMLRDMLLAEEKMKDQEKEEDPKDKRKEVEELLEEAMRKLGLFYHYGDLCAKL